MFLRKYNIQKAIFLLKHGVRDHMFYKKFSDGIIRSCKRCLFW